MISNWINSILDQEVVDGGLSLGVCEITEGGKGVYHQSQSNIITKSSSKSLVIYFGVFKVYRSTSKHKSTLRHKSTPSLPWSHYAKFPKDCTFYKITWYIGSWNIKLLN